ncbi:putative surface exclusion protein [Escherichia coli 3-105-05_S1_C3]|nr:putative surface exclusion protein [Escherichia coli 3-105-05_S1_C3]
MLGINNSPITLAISENQSEKKESPAGCSADKRKLSLCSNQRL